MPHNELSPKVSGMTKKKPHKPTGETGPVQMTVTADGAKAEFQKLEFPSAKDEIEAFIVGGFLRAAPSTGVFPEGCTAEQNPESDLDFTLICPDNQPRKMDLMEIAPLEDVQGSYAAAPDRHRPYDFAEKILGKITGKSDKYGAAGKTEFHLLMYKTDWKFTISETVVSLLQYWTVTTPHNFAGIYLYMPIDETGGVSNLIYPTPAEFWDGFDPEAFRNNEVINLDPKEWRPGG